MSEIISRFINDISRGGRLDFNDENAYTIYGDGVGDFEKSGDTTTENCLISYIDYCQQQIILAEEILDKLETTNEN